MGLKRAYADDRICPVCGKEFICYTKDQWTYKGYFDGVKVFCSWGCMRKMEKEKARTKGRWKKNERYISKTEE